MTGVAKFSSDLDIINSELIVGFENDGMRYGNSASFVNGKKMYRDTMMTDSDSKHDRKLKCT